MRLYSNQDESQKASSRPATITKDDYRGMPIHAWISIRNLLLLDLDRSKSYAHASRAWAAEAMATEQDYGKERIKK